MNDINCEHLIDYFNFELDDINRKKFDQHLAECESCREELSELNLLTEDLPFESTPMETPTGMKDRILTNVFASDAVKAEAKQEPEVKKEVVSPKINNKKNWLTPLLASCLLVSILGNAYWFITKDTTDENIARETNVTDKVLKKVKLNPSEKVTAQATAAMISKNNEMALVIQADKLIMLDGTETYQVWLLENGKPYRAGTFVPNDVGEGAVSYNVSNSSDHKWDTIAITIEPDASSETPKGEIILSSKL